MNTAIGIEPSPARGRVTAGELACVLLIASIASLWAWHTQRFNIGRLWDADEYFKLAERFASGAPIAVEPPFAYRVLTPWIVARCCAADILHGFMRVNVAASIASALVLPVWLAEFVADRRARLLVVAAYAFAWHGPIRFVYYDPVFIEPLFFVWLLVGLIIVERAARAGSNAPLALLAAVVFVGTAAREVMLLVPIVALAHPAQWTRDRRGVRALWLLAPLGAAIAAMAITHHAAPLRGGYSFVDAAWFHLTNKPPFSAILMWFITFGPVIVLVLYDWRSTARFLAAEPQLALFLAAIAALAYVGGHDTERYLFWSMPVVYVLVGRSLAAERRILASSAWLAAIVVLAQAVSERVFWPIPDPQTKVTALRDIPTLGAKAYSVLDRLFVIDDFHWNLWSNFGSRPFHALLLILYLVFSATILAWMHARGGRVALHD